MTPKLISCFNGMEKDVCRYVHLFFSFQNIFLQYDNKRMHSYTPHPEKGNVHVLNTQ